MGTIGLLLLSIFILAGDCLNFQHFPVGGVSGGGRDPRVGNRVSHPRNRATLREQSNEVEPTSLFLQRQEEEEVKERRVNRNRGRTGSRGRPVVIPPQRSEFSPFPVRQEPDILPTERVEDRRRVGLPRRRQQTTPTDHLQTTPRPRARAPPMSPTPRPFIPTFSLAVENEPSQQLTLDKSLQNIFTEQPRFAPRPTGPPQLARLATTKFVPTTTQPTTKFVAAPSPFVFLPPSSNNFQAVNNFQPQSLITEDLEGFHSQGQFVESRRNLQPQPELAVQRESFQSFQAFQARPEPVQPREEIFQPHQPVQSVQSHLSTQFRQPVQQVQSRQLLQPIQSRQSVQFRQPIQPAQSRQPVQPPPSRQPVQPVRSRVPKLADSMFGSGSLFSTDIALPENNGEGVYFSYSAIL